MTGRLRLSALLASLLLVFSLAAVDHADARRGGSFGSRGMRTFQAPAPTRTAPGVTAPVNRTMTPRTQAAQPGAAPAQARRPGLFGGMGRGLLGGLFLGGLFGMLLGTGFGGFAGFLGLIVQVALIALVAMLLVRVFRSRRQHEPAYAGAGSQAHRSSYQPSRPAPAAGSGSFRIPAIGSGAGRASASPAAPADEVGIGQSDLDRFEQMLTEVQEAFGREDYAALRTRTTPEIMSYLSEELGQNATNGLRNEVSDVKLLQGDLAEAWSEGDRDYATVAMRYESADVMRSRATGEIVSGDPHHPSETTELWTFVRDPGADWKLSAIQET